MLLCSILFIGKQISTTTSQKKGSTPTSTSHRTQCDTVQCDRDGKNRETSSDASGSLALLEIGVGKKENFEYRPRRILHIGTAIVIVS